MILKLKTYGAESDLLLLLKNCIQDHPKRVVLDSQISNWRKINSGVPERSVPGPLLFLIYINDLPDAITSICKTFADTSLFSIVYNIN